MPLVKWTPFLEPFEEMENMFSDMSPARRNQNGFMPAVDMYEEKDNVIVETELAGIDPDKVDIAIKNDCLSIKGEGEKKSEVDDKNYYRKEIKRGSFYRNIQLPAHVEGDRASAEAIDGVLKITIPKAEEKESRKIAIKTGKK